MTDWYFDPPDLRKVPLRAIRVHWLCPQTGCDGKMIANGYTWPTPDPGYHHMCSVCKFTAVIHGRRYPAIEYEEEHE